MNHSNQLNGSPLGVGYDTHYRCRTHGWFTHELCDQEDGSVICPKCKEKGRQGRMRTRRAFSNHGKKRPWIPSTPIQITNQTSP